MTNPIGRLAQAFQQAATNASNDLEEIAGKQSDMIDKKKDLRGAEDNFSTLKVQGESTVLGTSLGVGEIKDSFETSKSSPLTAKTTAPLSDDDSAKYLALLRRESKPKE